MTMTPRNNPPNPAASAHGSSYSAAAPLVLKLYIADSSPISLQAVGNLQDLLRALPPDCYQLEIIDALADPLRALNDGILVTPTLLKLAPVSFVSLLGDLHDRHQLAHLLGIAISSEL